jgi:hypothetical protein
MRKNFKDLTAEQQAERIKLANESLAKWEETKALWKRMGWKFEGGSVMTAPQVK